MAARSLGEWTRGDHGNVALEQRLQGCPASPDVPGGAAPGLHSGTISPAGSSPQWLISIPPSLLRLHSTVLRRCSRATFRDDFPAGSSPQWLISIPPSLLRLHSTVLRRCSAAADPDGSERRL